MELIANVDVLSRLNIPHEYWKMVEISEYNVPWGKTEKNKFALKFICINSQ